MQRARVERRSNLRVGEGKRRDKMISQKKISHQTYHSQWLRQVPHQTLIKIHREAKMINLT
jgi:hypothetical protein